MILLPFRRLSFMKKYDAKEISFVGFSFLFSLLLVVVSFSYPKDSSDFPRFLSSVMLLLSIAMVFTSLRSGKFRKTQSASPFSWEKLKIPAAVFAGVSLYVFAVRFFGYYLSTLAFLGLSMTLSGSRRFKMIAAATVLFLALVYVLFTYSLGLNFPRGLFFEA